MRVLVQTIPDCYTVLWVLFTLCGNRYQVDLKIISLYQKTNGYQSLHTTVITDNGLPLEIQIRTFAMHAISEYGIAAHWKYKEAGNKKYRS